MTARMEATATSPVTPGDTIVMAGTSHTVTSIARRNGFGWPIADCGDGWSITLAPDGTLTVPTPDDRHRLVRR